MKVYLRASDGCHFAGAERLPRQFWMRLLPPLRHYYCRHCEERFLAPRSLVEHYQWRKASEERAQLMAPPRPPVAN